MRTKIPVTFEYPILAMPLGKAAAAIGVSRWTLRRIIAMGKVGVLPHSTIAVSELDRYCRENARRAA